MNRFFAVGSLPGAFVLSCLLSLLGLLLLFRRRTGGLLRAAAMLVCMAGDLIMMNFRGINALLPIYPLFAGAAVFGVGHLLYAASSVQRLWKAAALRWNRGGYLGAALFGVLLASLVGLWLHNPGGGVHMLLVALGYAFVIGGNLFLAFLWAGWKGKESWLSALGALLFALSDLIIAVGAIGGLSIPSLEEWIWWLYPIGQVLLLVF